MLESAASNQYGDLGTLTAQRLHSWTSGLLSLDLPGRGSYLFTL